MEFDDLDEHQNDDSNTGSTRRKYFHFLGRSMDGQQATSSRTTRKRLICRLFFVGLILVLAVMTSLYITFRVMDKKAQKASEASSTGIPPSVNIPGANSTVGDIARFITIRDELKKTTEESVLLGVTPQHEALKWISYEDPLKLEPTSSSLVQRYSLVTLYFATSGDSWADKTKWLTGAPECEWSGIECTSDNQVSEKNRAFDSAREDDEHQAKVLQTRSFDAVTSVVKHIDLSNNNLTGDIIDEVKAFTQLESLRLSGNFLAGSIPSIVGHLTKLRILAAEKNQLVGSLPAEIQHLNSLTTLDLQHNSLEGPIPTKIASLLSLENMALNNNLLVGPVPSVLGELVQLETLHLHNNSLTGEIPVSIGNLRSLSNLTLDFNDLYGAVPVAVCAIGIRGLGANFALSLPKVTCGCCGQSGDRGEDTDPPSFSPVHSPTSATLENDTTALASSPGAGVQTAGPNSPTKAPSPLSPTQSPIIDSNATGNHSSHSESNGTLSDSNLSVESDAATSNGNPSNATTPEDQECWQKLSESNIRGQSDDDRLGTAVTISADGTRLVVGSGYIENSQVMDGQVSIYEFDSSSWSPMDTSNVTSGYSTALSMDGKRMAVGKLGSVSVYEFSEDSWKQVGEAITGTAEGWFGFSTALNGNGTHLAVGTPMDAQGSVSIYEFTVADGGAGRWKLKGNKIHGQNNTAHFGWSVSLAEALDVVVIGAPNTEDNTDKSSHVEAYEFDQSNTTWTQLGAPIVGSSKDRFGFALSTSDNATIIAVGAPQREVELEGTLADSGNVVVYQLLDEQWVQLGSSISGNSAGSNAGFSVALSNDGNSVAIGVPENDLVSGGTGGAVRVYDFVGSDWEQRELALSGVLQDDSAGYSVSMTADSRTVAVGAPQIDYGEVSSGRGYVMLYQYCKEIQSE